jgi:hypothetical protein
MMFMTARVDLKKILMALAIVAGIIAGALWLLGGDEDTATAAPSVSTNEGRVEFLKSFGWEAAQSPVESSQVRIPEQISEVYDRYNQLQKSQGYDLTNYAGKTAMRFVYKVNNYPGATEPVYATLLVYKNQIIGGDVTDTAANGVVRGFKMPKQNATLPSTTAPTGTAPVE